MNRWKAFALIMIALLAIAIGLRFTYLEAHTFPIDEEQRSFAINAAQNGLRDEIGNNNYNISCSHINKGGQGYIFPGKNNMYNSFLPS